MIELVKEVFINKLTNKKTMFFVKSAHIFMCTFFIDIKKCRMYYRGVRES